MVGLITTISLSRILEKVVSEIGLVSRSAI